MKYVNKDCEVLNCSQAALMVYIEGCDRDEVTDFLVCVEHAFEFCRIGYKCEFGHPILEKLVKMIDGSDPQDARFYPGEWVAEHHGRVVFHGNNPQSLILNVKDMGLAGTHIHYMSPTESEASWTG